MNRMVGGDQRHRVVVVGGGFGGLTAVKALARVDAEVTLIDRHNYHLFQPLLYQVATASLSPGDIASPIRWVLRHQNFALIVFVAIFAVTGDTDIIELKKDAATARRSATLTQMITNQQDAPTCPNCGNVVVRNGACYKCLNCGESLGCS